MPPSSLTPKRREHLARRRVYFDPGVNPVAVEAFLGRRLGPNERQQIRAHAEMYPDAKIFVDRMSDNPQSKGYGVWAVGACFTGEDGRWIERPIIEDEDSEAFTVWVEAKGGRVVARTDQKLARTLASLAEDEARLDRRRRRSVNTVAGCFYRPRPRRTRGCQGRHQGSRRGATTGSSRSSTDPPGEPPGEDPEHHVVVAALPVGGAA